MVYLDTTIDDYLNAEKTGKITVYQFCQEDPIF